MKPYPAPAPEPMTATRAALLSIEPPRDMSHPSTAMLANFGGLRLDAILRDALAVFVGDPAGDLHVFDAMPQYRVCGCGYRVRAHMNCGTYGCEVR